jgi:ribosome-binding protein aMBF1 (putative translation factor)
VEKAKTRKKTERCGPLSDVRLDNGKIDMALARKQWGMEDLAAKLEISRTALYYQRYTTTRPQTRVIGRIAEALGVDVSEIVIVGGAT